MRAFRFAGTTVVFAVAAWRRQRRRTRRTPRRAQALRAEIDQLKKDFDARLADSRVAAGGAWRRAAERGGRRAASRRRSRHAAGLTAGARRCAGGTGGALPVYGNASAASKVFNPDMAVIGNFLGAAGKNEVSPQPALQMPEAEVVVPGGRRSVRARRFLPVVRRGRRRRRGRLSSRSRRCPAGC